MSNKQELFEVVPPPLALGRMALPTILSQLITMVYNLADTYFIGCTGDPLKVAACTVSFLLLLLLNALSNLFGVGGGSLISRLLGRKLEEDARAVSAMSFYGAVLVSLVYCLLLLCFMTPLLHLVGTSNATLGYARNYTFWVVVVGGIPTTLGLTMAHLLRSVGYAREASLGLGAGGILNIILDPLFMFVLLPPGREVTGAAVATILSNVLVCVYYWLIFLRLRKSTVLSLSPGGIRRGSAFLREILSVGGPSALGSAISTVANMLVNSLMASYGDVAVAAMGIVKKIDLLPMNVGMGLCQGMMPLVAYNYAAGNYKRMRSFTLWASGCGMGFAALCIGLFELSAPELVGLFIRESETVLLGGRLLRICCLGIPMMIYNFLRSYSFQAMGKGRQPLFLQISRQGLIYIPLLLIMNRRFGLWGVAWAQFFSDAFTGLISTALYRRTYRQMTTV